MISDFLNARYADGRAFVFNECAVMARDVAAGVPEPDGRTILYIGRLAREKGVDVLVRAFALLGDDSAALLRIVGNGPERERLEALARELGVGARVEFAGGITDRGVLREEYRRATLFALPSRTEGLGCVLLEAMAAAMPIVATSAGGIPDLIADGENGLLAPPDDPAALAVALKRMLDDDALRRRCAVRGLEIVQRHTFELQTRRWIELAAAAARGAA